MSHCVLNLPHGTAQRTDILHITGSPSRLAQQTFYLAGGILHPLVGQNCISDGIKLCQKLPIVHDIHPRPFILFCHPGSVLTSFLTRMWLLI